MKNLFILILAILPATLFAQVQLERSVIGSTGGDAQAGDIQISFTVGEAVVETATSGTITLTQGFQQPGDINVGIEDPDFGISIEAYPNPTSDAVVLDLKTEKPYKFYVDIFDATGRKVLSEDNFSAENQYKHTINMSGYSSGNYFIRLRTEEGGFQKSLKIQKIK